MRIFVGSQRMWVAAILFVVLLVIVTAELSSRQLRQAPEPDQGRTDLCHRRGRDDYALINVSDQTLPMHLSHGDVPPGAYDLDQNCVPDTDRDGVGNPEDNCPATPNADQSDRYGSSNGDACEDDSNGDGVPDVDEENICVSIDGVEVILIGSSHCGSSPTTGTHPNIAVAHGEFADAGAYAGDNNTATADGPGATAFARNGDNNTAGAKGSCTVVVEFTSGLSDSCEGTDVER